MPITHCTYLPWGRLDTQHTPPGLDLLRSATVLPESCRRPALKYISKLIDGYRWADVPGTRRPR